MHTVYLATQLHVTTNDVVDLAFALGVLAIGGTPFPLSYLSREPKFRGPALTGTAQILSQRCIGTMSDNGALPRNIWRIRLRMEVPGRQPYDVTVWKRGSWYSVRGGLSEYKLTPPTRERFGPACEWANNSAIFEISH
jgi:hypothetical protein